MKVQFSRINAARQKETKMNRSLQEWWRRESAVLRERRSLIIFSEACEDISIARTEANDEVLREVLGAEGFEPIWIRLAISSGAVQLDSKGDLSVSTDFACILEKQ